MEGKFSQEEGRFIYSLLIRLMQCNRSNELYVNDDIDIKNLIRDKFLLLKVKRLTDCRLKNQIICLYKNGDNCNEVNHIIETCKDSNSVIVINNRWDVGGYSIPIKGSKKSVSLFGPYFNAVKLEVPKNFKVLAIIHIYNEADVIGKTTKYLLSQGIDVYLVDNWSSDNSYQLIKAFVEEYPDRVFGTRFPADRRRDYYDWYHQLEKTEEISKELNYSWYMHYDADEYRVSPWKEMPLREAIFYIDSLGFNLIENTVIDFKVTDKSNKSIFMKDTWFDFGREPTHFEQTKTWKKCETIDLKSSGGHIAKIDGPKVFPLKILNRHYPLRTFNHAKRKIFTDRKPRFVVENKKRGWHGHYDNVCCDEDIIASRENLFLWDENTFNELYIPLFMGCGIAVKRENTDIDISRFELDTEKSVSIYGAGKTGKMLYEGLSDKFVIDHWVDRNYDRIEPMKGRYIEAPDVLVVSDSQIVIAIEDEFIAETIKTELIKMGVIGGRIKWRKLKEG